MPIEFDSCALARFRNVDFRNDNATGNLDGKDLKAVARKVNAGDIDRLGPACCGIPGIF